MSGSEEETYSLMFSSLRHPARRKILRMLSEKTLTFSQMLEELSIPSSHLTYHLENLGELVIKEKDGKYKLSSFGNASVSLMKTAEDVPSPSAKRFSALPLRWRSVFVAFMVGMVLLASISAVEYSAINGLTGNYNDLKENLTKVQAINQRLLSWTPSGEEAMKIINDVIQLDVSKYDSSLESNTAQVRSDMGGVIEEVFKYSFVNSQSSLELTLRFRDGHFSLFQLTQLEGAPNYPPIYTHQQSTDILQATRDLVTRYRASMNDSYLPEITSLLKASTQTSEDQTYGNAKLQLSTLGVNSEAYITYTINDTDFVSKSLHVVLENRIVTQFNDDWFLYKIGSTQITISKEQAMLIAKNSAKSFSYNTNGATTSNMTVLDSPISVAFWGHTKTDSLTLYPYWYVTLRLDRTYPGGVNGIGVGIWADTGKVEAVQAIAAS